MESSAAVCKAEFPRSARKTIVEFGSGLKLLKVLSPIGRWAWGKFARQARWRAFHPWREYYRPYLQADAGHALIQHSGPFVGDALPQIELIKSLTAGSEFDGRWWHTCTYPNCTEKVLSDMTTS
jgi:hypothetical protein